jgi:hypothetical protein
MHSVKQQRVFVNINATVLSKVYANPMSVWNKSDASSSVVFIGKSSGFWIKFYSEMFPVITGKNLNDLGINEPVLVVHIHPLLATFLAHSKCCTFTLQPISRQKAFAILLTFPPGDKALHALPIIANFCASGDSRTKHQVSMVASPWDQQSRSATPLALLELPVLLYWWLSMQHICRKNETKLLVFLSHVTAHAAEGERSAKQTITNLIAARELGYKMAHRMR